MTTTRTSSRLGLFGDYLARRARSHASRLAEHRLRALDDHLLRDMGIERGRIHEVIATGRR